MAPLIFVLRSAQASSRLVSPTVLSGPLYGTARRTRFFIPATAFLVGAAFLGASLSARANSQDAVLAGAADLGINTTATYTTVANTTSDVTFLAATTYTNASSLDLSAALSIGTLDDLNATPISINGSGLLTLNSAANSVSGTAGDLLYASSGASLTVNTTGGITFTGNAGNVDAAGTISLGTSPVTIAAGKTLVFTGAGATTVNGIVSGGSGSSTSGLSKTGTGTLTLGGANTYTGLTNFSAGTVVATNTQAFGNPTTNAANQITTSSSVILNLLNDGGTGTVTGQTITYGVPGTSSATSSGYNVTVGSTTTFNVGNNGNTGSTGNTIQLGALADNSNFTVTNSNGYNLTFGTVTVGGGTFTNNMTNGTLTLASIADNTTGTQRLNFTGTSATATTTISGLLSAANLTSGSNLAVQQTGLGTLALINAAGNTYNGTTSVSGGGTLLVSNTSGSATGSGNVSIGSSSTGTGTLSSGPVASISGTVTTAGKTASVINPGGTGGIGMLTLGNLSLGTGATFAFDLGSSSGGTSSDSLVVGTLTATSATAGSLVFNFNNEGATAGTTYVLATFTTNSGLVVGDLAATGVSGTFSLANSGIDFTVTAVPEPSTWTSGVLMCVLGAFGLRGWRRRQA